MDNTKYLLVFAVGTGMGGSLVRLAAKINGDLWDERGMQYYHENDELKKHLKIDDYEIVRIEEIDGLIHL